MLGYKSVLTTLAAAVLLLGTSTPRQAVAFTVHLGSGC